MKSKISKIYLGAMLVLALALSLASSPQPVLAATLCVDPGGAGECFTTIQDAFSAASPGDIITIMPGTYALDSTLTLNKADITLQGVGNPLVQISGTGYRFLITASGVTIDGLRIEKTDKAGVQNIIGIQASNTSITNNEVFGQFAIGDGDVSRAMEMSGGISDLNVSGNTIHHVRQPAYINSPVLGTISNNHVYSTKGWVVAGGGVVFSGNTWGTGADVNVYDIAIISGATPDYYPDIVAMSKDNNDAVIEDQRVSPAVLSVVYVDTATAFTSDLGGLYHPYSTIAPALPRAAAGATIHVAAGTYIENLTISKPVEISGAGQGNTIVMPAVSNPNPCSGSSLCAGASNVFLVQASNVKIHDLTVDGDNPGLVSVYDVGGANLDARNGIIKNTNGTYNSLEVYNATVQNIYLRGIYSTGGTFNFHDNIVTNVQAEYASIAMFAWYGPGVMENNTVSYANDAISANHSKGIQFLNNTVTNSGSGVHTDNAGDGGGTADLIEGNTVSDCTPGGYGVWVFVPYIAPTVNNNTITNCSVGLSAWGQANPVTTQFTNNTVNGPAGEAGSVGVYLTTDWISWGYSDLSVALSGNFISGNETGIYLTADPQSWNSKPYEAKTITASFFNNSITGNTAGLDKGTSGTYNLSATPNWWDSATGPGHIGLGTGNTITAGVPYIPWLCSGTDTSGDPGFQPDLSALCSYHFTGFLQPIDMTAINIAKAGQTIPVQWRLIDANGLPVSDPGSFKSLRTNIGSCTASEPVDAIETYSGTSGLQYLGDGYWQFNWKTPKSYAGKCRTMYVEFFGGQTSPTVTFQFK